LQINLICYLCAQIAGTIAETIAGTIAERIENSKYSWNINLKHRIMLKKMIMLALIALPLSAAAQKFGRVNPAEIITAMPEYTKAQTELQELQKQYEGEMKIMQDELQEKGDKYDKEKDTLPAPVKERREKELQDIYTRLQQYAQESQQNLQKASQEKMNEISEKMEKAIKEVGVAGGYVYIMDMTAGVPFISETLTTDLTDQVKGKLGIK
jgi:outer membrane protein